MFKTYLFYEYDGYSIHLLPWLNYVWVKRPDGSLYFPPGARASEVVEVFARWHGTPDWNDEPHDTFAYNWLRGLLYREFRAHAIEQRKKQRLRDIERALLEDHLPPTPDGRLAFRTDYKQRKKLLHLHYASVRPKIGVHRERKVGLYEAYDIYFNPYTQRVGIGVHAPRPLLHITDEANRRFQKVVGLCTKYGYEVGHPIREELSIRWFEAEFPECMPLERIIAGDKLVSLEAGIKSLKQRLGDKQQRIAYLEKKLAKHQKPAASGAAEV